MELCRQDVFQVPVRIQQSRDCKCPVLEAKEKNGSYLAHQPSVCSCCSEANLVFEKDSRKAARNSSRTLTDGKLLVGVGETELTTEVRLLTIGCIYTQQMCWRVLLSSCQRGWRVEAVLNDLRRTNYRRCEQLPEWSSPRN